MNAAQSIHSRLGVAVGDSQQKQAHGNKNASTTKGGPGRFHAPGHAKAKPVISKGAAADFVLHTASAEKKQRRALIAEHGRRNAVRALKRVA